MNKIPFSYWDELSNDDLETKWVIIQTQRLPRQVSVIIIGGIYHHPPLPYAKDQPMISYILAGMERILQKHPDAGIILTADLN